MPLSRRSSPTSSSATATNIQGNSSRDQKKPSNDDKGVYNGREVTPKAPDDSLSIGSNATEMGATAQGASKRLIDYNKPQKMDIVSITTELKTLVENIVRKSDYPEIKRRIETNDLGMAIFNYFDNYLVATEETHKSKNKTYFAPIEVLDFLRGVKHNDSSKKLKMVEVSKEDATFINLFFKSVVKTIAYDNEVSSLIILMNRKNISREFMLPIIKLRMTDFWTTPELKKQILSNLSYMIRDQKLSLDDLQKITSHIIEFSEAMIEAVDNPTQNDDDYFEQAIPDSLIAIYQDIKDYKLNADSKQEKPLASASQNSSREPQTASRFSEASASAVAPAIPVSYNINPVLKDYILQLPKGLQEFFRTNDTQKLTETFKKVCSNTLGRDSEMAYPLPRIPREQLKFNFIKTIEIAGRELVCYVSEEFFSKGHLINKYKQYLQEICPQTINSTDRLFQQAVVISTEQAYFIDQLYDLLGNDKILVEIKEFALTISCFLYNQHNYQHINRITSMLKIINNIARLSKVKDQYKLLHITDIALFACSNKVKTIKLVVFATGLEGMDDPSIKKLIEEKNHRLL